MSLIKNHLICSIVIAMCAVISVRDLSAQESKAESKKYDEFIGELDFEDLMARLDFFAIELQKQPNAQGHIIVYRTRSDSPAVGRQHADRAKDYMIKTRGIDPRRILTVDGGMTGCLTYELWIVPPGAPPPTRRFTYQYSLKDSIDWPALTPKRKRSRR